MASSQTFEQRYQHCRKALTDRGQDHVLRWWDDLDAPARERLLSDIESIPWELVDPLIKTHVLNRPEHRIPENLMPPDVHPQPPRPADRQKYADARELGRRLLGEGKVAAFTVAGGQGTRLGFDGPKGAFPLGPIGDKTLFSYFADMVRAARDCYAAAIPWYIMTSEDNAADTAAFFETNDYFGLPREDVRMFKQGMLPAFDRGGKLLLESKDHLAMAPDGHGGSLKALVRSGALDDMRQRGVEIVSYFQIDNPLVKPFDPLFIGLHHATESDMSSKVLPKADDLEKVGNLCMAVGRLVLIEYSDFPEKLARERNADGSRKFDAGNPAIHMLDVEFVARVIERDFRMPFRRADKAVEHVDAAGRRVTPEKPNAVKLETFVFDVLPLANNPLLLQVDRAEEFSPVKNATGVDSVDTARRDLVERSCRWLESAGVKVPRDAEGFPAATIVVGPRFALDADEVAEKRDKIPAIRQGESVLLG
ncbi:MAG: UDPGP type 1 family protein [Phycisphaerae bacterium]|nr:UDPGP type 1 family protein [Phycisphaerae bacterium]